MTRIATEFTPSLRVMRIRRSTELTSSTFVRPAAIYIYNCQGKKNVYDIYSAVVAKHPTCRRVLFFVDKDIDDIVGELWPSDPRIFTTDVYSVENYCVCAAALRHYFQDFVKFRNADFDMTAVASQMEAELLTFYRLMLPIMAWIVAVRRSGKRPVLNDVRLDELLYLRDGSASRRPGRRATAYLERVTQVGPSAVTWPKVRAVCKELARFPPKTYIRGKFEAWFFVKLVRWLINETATASRETSGTVSQTVQLNETSFVQLVAAAVGMPTQLEVFLLFHLGPTQPRLEERPSEARRSVVQMVRSFFTP